MTAEFLPPLAPVCFQISVRQVRQSGAGSFVAVYDASVELNATRRLAVRVETVIPPDADRELVGAAVDAIRAGAEEVLLPLGYGAEICLQRLLVHATDCRPERYRRATVDALMARFG